jgi:hypothetical protein
MPGILGLMMLLSMILCNLEIFVFLNTLHQQRLLLLLIALVSVANN